MLPLILAGTALVAASAQVGPQVEFPPPILQFPQASVASAPEKPVKPDPARVPIDLGPDAPVAEKPQQIDILAPQPTSAAATAAELKECTDEAERGVVAGEIVVCRQLPADTSQIYSGTHEAWQKDYAQRTQNKGTLPPPDVAGPGIFRGAPTVSGLCVIGPCPKDKALIVDVEAIPPPPAGSDAARVAQGLAPTQTDDAPLSDEDRRRIEAELGLPPATRQ